VDLLAEAQTEQQYLEFATADEKTRDAARNHFIATDTRLPPRSAPADPVRRARSSRARRSITSQTVNQLCNELIPEGGQALLNLDGLTPDAAQLRVRVRVGDITDDLEAAVRHDGLSAQARSPGKY
jgi:hypothetical protein